jgi:hypothetical protein
MVMDERYITVDSRIERVRRDPERVRPDAYFEHLGQALRDSIDTEIDPGEHARADGTPCVDFVHPYRVM